MIVEIPFVYTARVTLPRCRNATTVVIRGERCPVRIAEATADEAPLVARIPGRADGDLAEHYRSFQGGLLRRFHARTHGVTLPTMLHKNSIEANLDELIRMQHWSPFVDKLQAGPALHIPRERVRIWHADNREKLMGEIRRKLAGAVFVDGVLFVKSNGPAWVVRHADRSEVWLETANEFTGLGDDLEFRGDRYADALTSALQMIEDLVRRGQRTAGRPLEVKGEIEVLRPEAFTFDDDWAHFSSSVRRFLAATGRDIHKWPRDAVMAYIDLRDSMPTWPKTLSASRFDAVLAMRRGVAGIDLSRFGIDTLDQAIDRVAPRVDAARAEVLDLDAFDRELDAETGRRR